MASPEQLKDCVRRSCFHVVECERAADFAPLAVSCRGTEQFVFPFLRIFDINPELRAGSGLDPGRQNVGAAVSEPDSADACKRFLPQVKVTS